ncbi:MAG: Hfq-like protein [Pyrinomonadaceae bacterium]
MNRKLIRTTLAEVKGRGDSHQPRERDTQNRGGSHSSHSSHRGSGGGGRPEQSSNSSSAAALAAAQGRKRVPPSETNAEIFYYKKQMDAHTVMVMVLLDGEEIEGTIEWYDRSALKVNRKDEPNILLLKHNIKYMFKAEDRDGDAEEGGD